MIIFSIITVQLSMKKLKVSSPLHADADSQRLGCHDCGWGIFLYG